VFWRFHPIVPGRGECVALEVDRGIKAEKVIDVLADLFRIRGVPKHIRSDNGPEFIAQAIRRWLAGGDLGDKD